jgi:hypothetical protein
MKINKSYRAFLTNLARNNDTQVYKRMNTFMVDADSTGYWVSCKPDKALAQPQASMPLKS